MQLVMHLNINGGSTFGYRHAAQSTGKGLFLNMGMMKHPLAQHMILAINHPPIVRVMVSASVGMLQGHAH